MTVMYLMRSPVRRRSRCPESMCHRAASYTSYVPSTPPGPRRTGTGGRCGAGAAGEVSAGSRYRAAGPSLGKKRTHVPSGRPAGTGRTAGPAPGGSAAPAVPPRPFSAEAVLSHSWADSAFSGRYRLRTCCFTRRFSAVPAADDTVHRGAPARCPGSRSAVQQASQCDILSLLSGIRPGYRGY